MIDEIVKFCKSCSTRPYRGQLYERAKDCDANKLVLLARTVKLKLIIVLLP